MWPKPTSTVPCTEHRAGSGQEQTLVHQREKLFRRTSQKSYFKLHTLREEVKSSLRHSSVSWHATSTAKTHAHTILKSVGSQ